MPERTPLALEPATPWALRVFDRVGLPAFWVGVGIGLGVFALWVAFSVVAGPSLAKLPWVVPGDASWVWVAELIQDLFIGFTLAVAAASIRGARADLLALLPHLDVATAEHERLAREVFRYARLPLAAIAMAVGALSMALILSDPGLWGADGEPQWSNPGTFWLVGRNFLNWWAVGLAMALELMLGRAFSGLGERLAPFDLLDRAPLAPFAARALRNVFLWMLLAAFLSLTYVGEGWATGRMPLALAGLGGFAVTAFVIPLLGARRRIRALKQAELARVRAALRDARESALGQAEGRGGRLADLLAYEARLQGVAEWPIDASTLVRLALYLLFGLGSWVGAAVVERMVDTALA